MKLLRDSALLHFARRVLAARRSPSRATYRVTVPAPRAQAGDHAAPPAGHRGDGHEWPPLRSGNRRSSGQPALAGRQ